MKALLARITGTSLLPFGPADHSTDQAMIESHAALASAYEHLPVATLLCDASGMIRYRNQAFIRDWETPDTPMNGYGLGTLVLPLDANAITELMQESHHSDGHHCEAVDACGTLNEVTLYSAAVKLPSGEQALCINLLPRLAVPGRHQPQQSLVEQTLSQSVDGVVSIDEQNRITFFNPAAEKLCGYKAEEVLGENVKTLVPSHVKPDHDNHVNANRMAARITLSVRPRSCRCPTRMAPSAGPASRYQNSNWGMKPITPPFYATLPLRSPCVRPCSARWMSWIRAASGSAVWSPVSMNWPLKRICFQ